MLTIFVIWRDGWPFSNNHINGKPSQDQCLYYLFSFHMCSVRFHFFFNFRKSISEPPSTPENNMLTEVNKKKESPVLPVPEFININQVSRFVSEQRNLNWSWLSRRRTVYSSASLYHPSSMGLAKRWKSPKPIARSKRRLHPSRTRKWRVLPNVAIQHVKRWTDWNDRTRAMTRINGATDLVSNWTKLTRKCIGHLSSQRYLSDFQDQSANYC